MSVEETREILEKVIQKPQLTDQLLSRPPFKFIVDIVSNVIKSTGYLKTDFTDDEIKSAGNDKNTKTAFLDKLIKILDDGSLKNVKAAKIISGKDAEETNKMLQMLGTNATSFNSRNGTGEEKKKKKVKKEDKKGDEEEKSTTKKRSSKKETHEEKEKSEKKKSAEEKEKKKKSSSSKERHKSSDRSSEKSSEKSSKEKKKEKSTTDEKPKKSKKDPSERHFKRQDSMIAVNGDAPDTPNNENGDEGYDDHEISEPTVISNMETDLSAQSLLIQQPVTSPLKTDDSGMGESPRMIKPEDRPPLIRPMTGAGGGRPMTSMGRPGTAASRPAPPKLKKKQIATVDSTPQVVVELKSEIISDAPKVETEDDSNFIMENDEEDGDRTARIEDLVDEEDRGALVQKIMETKAEIEDGGGQDQVEESDADKIMTVEREKMKQLQEKLQDLTRSAYPLARLFDFANDDIESMIKELERWRSEQRRNEQEDQNKKAAGFGDSSRLYNIIANLQKEINDTKEELSKARGRVLNNEKRIQLFISNV